ncbi:hypothetical protein BS47DRAFT_1399824 [Hydnum rufescens UP504]|uniref:Uncharacterized protein n=1 Tax=Hydnum rufescens UP504 TaxID=1448309 RepID=A0A9P6AHP8_9AGAM|nr:hypothetical protein BS47DRAFT_1399824 [Hydnum rufescens UP504]
MRFKSIERKKLDELTDESRLSTCTYKDPSTEPDPPRFSKEMSFVSKILDLLSWRPKGWPRIRETPHFEEQVGISSADTSKFKRNYTSRLDNNSVVPSLYESGVIREILYSPNDGKYESITQDPERDNSLILLKNLARTRETNLMNLWRRTMDLSYSSLLDVPCIETERICNRADLVSNPGSHGENIGAEDSRSSDLMLLILLGDHVKTRCLHCPTSSTQLRMNNGLFVALSDLLENSREPVKHMVFYTELEMTRTDDCSDLSRSLCSRDKHVDIEGTKILDPLRVNSRNLLKGFNKDRLMKLTKANLPTPEEVGAIIHYSSSSTQLETCETLIDILAELFDKVPYIESECVCNRANLLSSLGLHGSDLRCVKWLILLMDLANTREMHLRELYLSHTRDSDVAFWNRSSSIIINVPAESLKVLELSPTRPEYIPDCADLISARARSLCDRYGDFEKPMPFYSRRAKSWDLYKPLSKCGKVAITKSCSPLFDEPKNYRTCAPEVVMDIVLHTPCKKKSPDFQVLYKSKLDGLPSGFGHVHDNGGSSFQCTMILTNIFKVLVPTTLKQSDKVAIRHYTMDVVRVLKNFLLPTRNKAPLLDNTFLVRKDLPRGLLTRIPHNNGASRPPDQMAGSRLQYTYGEVEDATIFHLQYAKSMDLLKDLSRLAKKSLIATYLPLHKSPPSIVMILGEVLEDTRIVLEKEEWRELHATQTVESERTCKDRDTSSQHAEAYVASPRVLMFAMSKQLDPVDIRWQPTIHLACDMKNDLLKTRNKPFLLNDHLQGIKNLAHGVLTFVLHHVDETDTRSAVLEGNPFEPECYGFHTEKRQDFERKLET